MHFLLSQPRDDEVDGNNTSRPAYVLQRDKFIKLGTAHSLVKPPNPGERFRFPNELFKTP